LTSAAWSIDRQRDGFHVEIDDFGLARLERLDARFAGW